MKRTALSLASRQLGARMMEFAGWEMPVWYTSILDEHRAVRSRAGIFDVSHMGRVWLTGKGAGVFLDRLLSRPVQHLAIGDSRLCLLCLEDGGILDDLWVYRVAPERFFLVWNASNIEGKHSWLQRWAGKDPDFTINDVTLDTAMVAVQGPMVRSLASLKAALDLPRFGHSQIRINDIEVFIARTGYTGEEGFEIIVSNADAVRLWELFLAQGVRPCGLGARDSLRLEAGMLLYGHDMDIHTNPFEAGLGWLVELNKREFIAKEALLKIKAQGIKRKLVGFEMLGREIARAGYKIFQAGKEIGAVTSGGYAPTLGKNIGLGYVTIEASAIGTNIEINVRNRMAPGRIVNQRFYQRKDGT